MERFSSYRIGKLMTYSYDSYGKYYMQEASGHYFTEQLPDGWDTWDEEQLEEWCAANAWEPFEYHDTGWVFEQAWNLAVNIHTCVEKATKPLEDAVAECEQEIERLRKRLRILHGEEE